MSFVCEEDGNQMSAFDQAFCVTTQVAEIYSAVCQAHIDKIPQEERLKERLERGLDIHFLFARASGIAEFGFAETIAMRGAEFGDYRFTVREEVGRLLLPLCSKLYLD